MLLAGVRVHEVGEFFTRAELFKSREKPHAAPGPIFCLRGAFYIANGTKTTTFFFFFWRFQNVKNNFSTMTFLSSR